MNIHYLGQIHYWIRTRVFVCAVRKRHDELPRFGGAVSVFVCAVRVLVCVVRVLVCAVRVFVCAAVTVVGHRNYCLVAIPKNVGADPIRGDQGIQLCMGF